MAVALPLLHRAAETEHCGPFPCGASAQPASPSRVSSVRVCGDHLARPRTHSVTESPVSTSRGEEEVGDIRWLP